MEISDITRCNTLYYHTPNAGLLTFALDDNYRHQHYISFVIKSAAIRPD